MYSLDLLFRFHSHSVLRGTPFPYIDNTEREREREREKESERERGKNEMGEPCEDCEGGAKQTRERVPGVCRGGRNVKAFL